MKKQIIGNLEKCYSIAPLNYKGKKHILVAAEKQNRCILFDLEGNQEETVWEGPGGVMTMVQVPGTDGQFLATHKFYSPNDSKEAKIVIATPALEEGWKIRTLVDLPFVHRFDILESDGKKYLIACTLKSGHEYKDDWSMPGKVYAAVLPDDLTPYNEENQLELTVIKDGMLKNHGYYRVNMQNEQAALISCEQGVFLFYPPKNGEEWKVEQLLDTPTSDATLIDLNGDGEKELVVIAPFHGSDISIYEKKSNGYEEVYKYPEEAEFVHAIWSGSICNQPVTVIGHRKGDRKLLKFYYDKKIGEYKFEVLDSGCGAANAYGYTSEGKDILIATNREIDEIALYRF